MDELIMLRKKILELEQNLILFNETEKSGKVGGWQFDPVTLKQTWTDEVFRILEIDLENGAPEVPKGIEFIDSEFRPMAEKAIQQAMEHGEPYNQEWIVTTDKGNKKWVTAACNPKIKNGKVVSVSGSFQDITSKKIVEEELKKSEEKHRDVIDNSPFPIAVVDEKDQNLLLWSKSAKQLFGHDPKTTQEWYELAYPNPEYRQQVIKRWKSFLEIAQNSSKAINTGEYQIHCKNQSVKICEIYAQFIPGSLVITLNDITERKNAEDHLKVLNQQLLANEKQLKASYQQLIETKEEAELSESKFRNAFENAGIGMCLVSLDGKFLKLNESALRIWGYKEAEMLDMTFQQITHPDDLENDLKLLNNSIEGKISNYSIVKRYYDIKGEIIFTNLNVSLVRNVKNEPLFFVSQIEDITKQIIFEQELINAKEKAEESERLKSAFLANMSHEIRTPMNGILGFTDLLEEADTSQEERKRYTSIVRSSGERLLELMNNLIDFSKAEAGQMMVSKTNVDITEVFQRLEGIFQSERVQKKIDLTFHNESNQRLVYTDLNFFESVLINLIKNAIKFTDQGFIKVNCKNNSEGLSLYVQDTGKGIHQENINSIFERFNQEDISLTKKYEGAGLGLSISKSYIDLLGGKIWAESELGKGSTFYFTIPFQNTES